MTDCETGPVILNASCVALDGKAVLLTGPSGAGKSSLALQLLALGLDLVADDRTVAEAIDGALSVRCPPAIRGRIEARGVGLLAAETVERAWARLVVDLASHESERLPPMREVVICGVALPVVHNSAHSHLPAAIVQYLKGGRSA